MEYVPVRIQKFFTSAWVAPSRRLLVLSACIVVVLYAAFYGQFLSPPDTFPNQSLVTVPEGATLDEIAMLFKREGIVRSALWLELFVRLYRGEGGAQAGNYYFLEEKSVREVARGLTHGEFGLVPISVTLPEGSTVKDMAHILEEALPAFSSEEFIAMALPLEGFLFPDTYFFLPDSAAADVIATMQATFAQKIALVEDEIEAFGIPLRDVIIMASLLEEEARTTETRRMISGILWKRLEIGMPLQVDAVFPYIIGKNTFELTLSDLQVDSPYNTYRYIGLPYGPISNPSLDAITAAVTPIESEYLFYLSDMSGNMHYSVTFDEHLSKKSLYLN